jgi:hypothetical protein
MTAWTPQMKSSTTSPASARESPPDIPRAPVTMRLLDRQARLIEYLTSRGAIFGEGGDAPLDHALRGMDPRLLRLEACFSHEKRMAKIATVFPRTFRLLGADRAAIFREAIVREFVAACPPTDITRITNARQFHDFLRARWRRQPPEPPYLRDVAACEFAIAKVRVGAKVQELEPRGEHAPRDGIRRRPDVALLRCAYDIRPIFEADSGQAAPAKRDTLLIIMPPGALNPKVFEVLPVVYDILAAIDDWTDRSALGATPEVDRLIGDLAAHELIEVRG